ncbi:MAG: EamA family transporter [Bacillota bacterium]|nr:EamA family transporter [Bacillota bacterium]
MKNKVLMGSIFCIFAACCWGVSGAAGQFLFDHTGITPEWLVSTRTLAVGILMLAFLQIRKGGVFEIWTDKDDRKGIVIFTLGGMLFMQYGYFAAIDHCNAATATVLQYTAPILIVVYLALRNKKLPTLVESIAVAGCLIGTILLATHGDLNNLSLSPLALFWGLLSAVALAFYTIYPTRLLAKYDTMLLIGWSMLIGSFVMHFVHPSWDYAANWDLPGVAAMVFIILFGTMTPYLLFLNGVKYIGPTKSSLFASAEPIASTVVSVVWLKVGLEAMDYLGFVFIVTAVLMLSFIKPKEAKA